MANDARVSQLVEESAGSGSNTALARVSQLIQEALGSGSNTSIARVSQVALEAAAKGANSAQARVSQILLELASPVIKEVRVSQLVLEIASPFCSCDQDAFVVMPCVRGRNSTKFAVTSANINTTACSCPALGLTVLPVVIAG